MSLIFYYCPRFCCTLIALKSRTFVVKSRAEFPTNFVRDLDAKRPNGPGAHRPEDMISCGLGPPTLGPRLEYKTRLEFRDLTAVS